MHSHNTTGAPSASVETQRTWREIKAQLEAARAAEVRYDRDVWTPAYEAATANGTTVSAAVSAEMERLGEARCDIEDVMAFIPADDLEGTIYKIERSRSRWEGFDGFPDSWWDAIMSDLRRFAGQEAVQ